MTAGITRFLAVQDEHELRYQLSSAAVDAKTGIIRGATVAKSGVPAVGKFVFVDANGQLTRDPDQAKRKFQVVTDDKTLETLMAAVAAAGGRVKVRSDHDDSLSARAGYAEAFRREGDRIACDLHLFDSYKDRAIVIETADETPDQIGLSIDFTPEFDITNEGALMRVGELNAVDIVDAGAITPAGLFLARSVDTHSNTNLATNNLLMADKKDEAPDKVDQCLSALNKLMDSHAELLKGHAALSEKVDKLTPKPAADAPAAKADDSDEEMSATLKNINEKLSSQAEAIATMQKERAALGLKSTNEGAKAAAASAADESTAQLKETKPKTYLELVELKKSEKLSASDAHRFVMKHHPDAYAAHIKALGITSK